MNKPKRKRAKPFEAVVSDPATGQESVLSEHTTSRAALNALAFRAFFGDPKYQYRVRDKRTGEWVSELSRS